MVSIKLTKKVRILIIFLIIFLVSLTVTKVIYDSTFPRYDCGVEKYPIHLESTVAPRQTFSFNSGKNTLQGFLYESFVNDKKDCLIILAPGHNACADSYLWQIHELLSYGWSVFAFDTTGTCHSEGKSSVGFSQEVLDLKASIEYVNSQDNFSYNNIALLGHSRGGYAVCSALAYDYDISAVISISGVNSAMEGIIGASKKRVGPLAYTNHGFLWLYQAMLFGPKTASLRADKIIKNSDTPVLLIHGADDKDYPPDKYSIVSHFKKDCDNAEIIIRTSPDNSGHSNLLFAEDGTADDGIIEKINEFLNLSIK